MPRNTTDNKQNCSLCGLNFAPNVFKRHQKACQRDADNQKAAALFQQQQFDNGRSDNIERGEL